jgi:CRP-like cAMP-binding protein
LAEAHRILIRKLREHSRLANEDLAQIKALTYALKELKSNEDLIRQGDDPDVSALVMSGMVARYHLLQNGRRQRYYGANATRNLTDPPPLLADAPRQDSNEASPLHPQPTA